MIIRYLPLLFFVLKKEKTKTKQGRENIEEEKHFRMRSWSGFSTMDSQRQLGRAAIIKNSMEKLFFTSLVQFVYEEMHLFFDGKYVKNFVHRNILLVGCEIHLFLGMKYDNSDKNNRRGKLRNHFTEQP